MSKIGDLLNKDVGSLATKVLKADVADIVKGAGRALNTDVGTIAKGAGKVLSYDLTDLFVEAEDDKADPSTPPAVATAPTTDASPRTGGLVSQGIVAPPAQATAASSGIDAGGPASTAAFTAIKKTSPSANENTGPASSGELPKARLTEALVNRTSLKAPEGSDLISLLPLQVGAYARSKDSAQGDIASDPVTVTYSNSAEAVSVTIFSCWDADEASEKLKRGKSKLENSRGSVDQCWIAGIDARGVVFLWTRGSYCYEIVSPRGVSAIARFLADFIY